MLMKFLTSSPIENSHITERHYADTIIAFSSFMATDIGGKHILENNQLQTLLHLTEGVEPTPERVKKELAKIDINKDGYVQIDEWLGYLSTCDPVTGVVYFDYELKQKFDQVVYIYIYILYIYIYIELLYIYNIYIYSTMKIIQEV